MKREQLNISDIYRELVNLADSDGGTTFTPTTPTTQPPNVPQAANQLRNGSFAHSVGSWANVGTADSRRYECEHWYSHPDTDNIGLSTRNTTTADKSFTAANVTSSGGAINIAIATHGFATADPIVFATTGTLPTNITAGTEYYAIRVDANNIKVASSVANAYAGTAIAYVAAGAGSSTVNWVNYTLKSDDHSGYSSSQSNWTRQDAPAGCSRINADYTLDAPLPQPTAEPGYTLYAVFNIAKASQYIFAPPEARLTCGMYAKQNNIWEYLKGAFEIDSAVSGTVSTPTAREYVVHVRTSRGFTLQTSAEAVASAPSDTDYTGGAVVTLNWPRALQYGVIGYDVYRKTLKTFVDGDVDTGTEEVTIADHTFTTGDAITLTTTGVLPGGLATATTYYIIRNDANTIRFATSAANAEAGTAIDITSAAGGGTHTVNAFKILERVETGLNSYIDNGSYLNDVVTAYPSADFEYLVAFTASLNNVVANLNADGVDDTWDTLPFALRVPANYDHSLTDFDRKQWVRWNLIGLNGGRLDTRVTDGSVLTGDATLTTTSSGQFTAGKVGKTVVITGRGGQVHTTTIASFTGVNEVEMTDVSPFDHDDGTATVVVEGGADLNVLYQDLAHLSFGENAVFSFHPDDLSPDRGIPPVAANGSNQGGTGGPTSGGGGDGGPICPWENEWITVTDGAGSIFQKQAKDLRAATRDEPGDYTIFGKRIGEVIGLSYHVADIYRTETENGFVAYASDTHTYLDSTGKCRPSVSDEILTQINGKDVLTRVKSRELFMEKGVVVKIKLRHYHKYLIGQGEGKWSGIGSHNEKPIDGPQF